jgi:hypothetical protein
MTVIYLLLLLLAGVFFGLAAGRVYSRIDWLALGLLCWVLVPLLQTANRM